ncbi:MAG: ABC transporter permease [Burkholderiales bacterium]|nr:ABC transporter permease [Burkholderiales bacterium]
MPKNAIARRVLLRIAPGALFLAAWWIAVRKNENLIFYLSTPQNVASFLSSSISSENFWSNYLSTMYATLISFVIGSFTGIAAGIAVPLMPRLDEAIEPYAAFLNSLPRIALAPVFIAFLGLGLLSKVAVGFSLVFFILFYNCRAGVKSVDDDLRMLAHALDFSSTQLFFKLLIPTAWPAMFSGLRLGFTYALLGVVSSEIVASRAGLGQLIMFYSAQFDMGAVYGVLIWMGITSGGIYWLTGRLEKRLLAWKV